MSDLGSAGSARSSLNHPIKILIVGDGAVGKTALCTVFREMKKEKPPTEEELRESILSNYEPTIFENDNYTTTVEDEEVAVNLMDTAGQEDLKHLRILSYPGTHTFIVCFSVVDKTSFQNLYRDGGPEDGLNNWLIELRNGSPGAKILLVGTKKDLRGQKPASDTGASRKHSEVSPREINKLVRSQQLDGYIETSAMTESDQVATVFEEAARLALGKDPNFLPNEPESTGVVRLLQHTGCFDFLKRKL